MDLVILNDRVARLLLILVDVDLVCPFLVQHEADEPIHRAGRL
jgi:hypothetical protein